MLLQAVAVCSYKPLREDEIGLEEGEEVSICEVSARVATIRKDNGKTGKVPVYFLEIADIPGATLAEQIEYRRNWYAIVDSCDYINSVSPLSIPSSIRAETKKCYFNDGRPIFTRELVDVHVKVGESVILHPKIESNSNFSIVWRGPAVERKRAKIETDGQSTRLVIPEAVFLDSGPYSIVAENEYGITSSVAQVKVATKPVPPSYLTATRNGWRAIRLSWKASNSKAVRYCIEYKRADMPTFWCASSDLNATKVNLRQFRAAEYKIRVFAYSIHFRSEPTEEILVDFRSERDGQEPPVLENIYRLGSIIGYGRFSSVYNVFEKCSRPGLVAKVFSKKRDFLDMKREAKICLKLSSKYIPRSFGLFQSQKGYCIVMERKSGVDISEYVDGLHSFTEDILQLLCRQTLKALRYLHEKEIMHLDVKPANLIVRDRVVLIDFGSARELRDNAEWGEADRSFSAPERIGGKPPTMKSDVWSLGAVVCHICFGEPPHKTATALQKAHDRFSPHLLSFLNEILAVTPERRRTSAEALQHVWMNEHLLSKLPQHEEIRRGSRLSVERTELSRSASFDWS